jgi:hypothetical protein
MNLIILVCFFLVTTLTTANPETLLESSIDGAEDFSAKTTTRGHRPINFKSSCISILDQVYLD